MFDLFRSREKAVRILLGGILVVVSLSMLTYLIPSYGGASDDSSDMVVAQVGKEAITVPEVQTIIQQTLRGRQIPASLLPTYIPQMVDGLVMQRALAYQAEQLGFQVSATDMSDAIRQMVPGLFQEGKFVGKEAYAAFLAQQNLSIGQFEDDLKRQMLASRLRAVALEGIIVTDAEIAQEYHRKNDQIKVSWVKLTADKYKDVSQPTTEEMQAYYKANIARYQVPEKRNLAVLLGDPAKMEQNLTPPDSDLQRMYEQNKDSFRTPERVRVQHILLKTTDKPAADDAKIKAQAEDLLKQIRAGANFSELAKKYSEDEASAKNAKNPGELPDWITRGQTVKEFEQAAFTLKPGQVSDLVKTQYGYHIVKVLAHEDAHLRTFDEAKSDLIAQWKKQHVNDLMQNISDKAQTALQKDPAHPEKVASDFGMQLLRVEGYQPGQPLPEVGMSQDFDQSLSGLKQGEASQPVALADNKIALAVVTAVIPARASTFDEVKDQVRQTLVQNRSANELQKHALELADAAKKGGDLAKAAKTMGLEVKTSDAFNRSGSVEGIGSATYLQDAFNRPDGSVVGPMNVADGTVVVQVVQHIPADMSKLAEQRASIRDEVKNQKARDREALFEEGIRDALIKSGKIKVHQAVIKRLITSYNSAS